jgi:hypothetical protein
VDIDGYVEMYSIPHEYLGGWELRTPGTYRVIVRYVGPTIWPGVQTPPPPSGTGAGESLAVTADTAVIPVTRPLVDGRRLADTAMLVVVP